MPYEDLRRVLHKKRNAMQETQELTNNATNEMSISQATKMSCHQLNTKVNEEGSKTLNTQTQSQSESQCHSNKDVTGHEKSYQNSIESLLPLATSSPTASAINCK